MAFVGISLGSNLGARLNHLGKALACLRESGEICVSTHLLVSSVYETEPVDCPPGSESFYNAVIEIETGLAPLDLLRKTQEIERTLGRPAERERNAPRTVDLDLLYYDDLEFVNAGLVLPHPRMWERAFVLLPLSEIRPDLIPDGFDLDAMAHGVKKLTAFPT
mgnify:CR=1 FL=1